MAPAAPAGHRCQRSYSSPISRMAGEPGSSCILSILYLFVTSHQYMYIICISYVYHWIYVIYDNICSSRSSRARKTCLIIMYYTLLYYIQLDVLVAHIHVVFCWFEVHSHCHRILVISTERSGFVAEVLDFPLPKQSCRSSSELGVDEAATMRQVETISNYKIIYKVSTHIHTQGISKDLTVNTQLIHRWYTCISMSVLLPIWSSFRAQTGQEQQLFTRQKRIFKQMLPPPCDEPLGGHWEGQKRPAAFLKRM
jgi:hypothetical protein